MNILRQHYNRHGWIRNLLSPVRDLRTQYLRTQRKTRAVAFQHFISMLAEDPVLVVNEFQGRFRIGRQSSILEKLFDDGNYELPLSTLVPRLVDPQRDAIDVGANLGFYSVLLAKLLPNRRVLAFEPIAEAIARLEYNLNLNDVRDQVIVCPNIASGAPGNLEMKVVVGQEEYSTVGQMHHPRVKETDFTVRNVACTTIDSQVQANNLDPAFIKIDAEGSEFEVLNGCLATLEKFRPVIMSEFSHELLEANGASTNDIIELVTKLDYVAVDPSHPKEMFFSKDYGDVFLIPKEQHKAFVESICTCQASLS